MGGLTDQISAIAKSIPGIIRGINLLADRVQAIDAKLITIQQTQEKIMSELDDAKAAMSNLVTAVQTGTAEISSLVAKILALLGAPGGVDPAEVEKLAVAAQAQADAINAAVADAKGQTGV